MSIAIMITVPLNDRKEIHVYRGDNILEAMKAIIRFENQRSGFKKFFCKNPYSFCTNAHSNIGFDNKTCLEVLTALTKKHDQTQNLDWEINSKLQNSKAPRDLSPGAFFYFIFFLIIKY